jgi:Domain of unknown function (DUF4437)
MVKLVPDAMVHADHVAFRPWDEQRTMPFVANGANDSRAWVKLLSRDAETGAETLIYKLDQGWSASSIENTVYENLLVLDGVLEADGSTLGKYDYCYRPEGHRTDDVSTPTGVTVISYAGAPGEPSSKIPVPHLDFQTTPWVEYPVGPAARYTIKMLRGDEENLDTFFIMRAPCGHKAQGVTKHDAPEEAFFLEGRTEFYDGVTEGRLIGTKGTYVHRGPWSPHGYTTILEDQLLFMHDYFVGESEPIQEIFFASYPVETPAVKAVREGRVPELPKRW